MAGYSDRGGFAAEILALRHQLKNTQ